MAPQRGDEERDVELHLEEEIAEEPSLDFETLPDTRPLKYTIANGLWNYHGSGYYGGPERYHVRLVENDDGLDSVFRLGEMDAGARSGIEAIDFDEHVLATVESGYGSGSRTHRWLRVEPIKGGIHLDGCYAGSLETDALWAYHSVLKVARPDDTPVDVARVSLTVEEGRTVTFDSTDGALTNQSSD